MSSARGAVLVLAGALAAGCRIAEERAHDVLPLEVPAAWDAEAAEGQPSLTWWHELAVPGLAEVVDEALAHNHDVAAALARVEAAAALARVEGARRLPTLDLSAAARRQRQNFVGFPLPGGGSDVLSTETTTYGVSLDVSWEVDLWGKLAAIEKAALAELAASEAEYAGVRQSLAAQVAKAWLALAEARMQVELARQTVDSFASNVTFVRERFAQGRAQALDLRLLETDLASAEASLQLRLEIEATVRRQVEVLLGRYPEGELAGLEELPAVPGPVPAGLPLDLLDRRPDLVAAEQRLASLDYRLYEARADLYPGLVLTASGGRLSEELEDLLDSDFDVWSLAGQVVQPLFQGGRLRALVDLAEAQAREALELYTQSVLTAFAEVEILLAIERSLAEREARLATAAEHAVAAQSLSEDRYRTGLTDVTTVLAAQIRSVEAQSRAIEARRERLEARVDMYLALGGGFEPEDAAEPAAEGEAEGVRP